MQQLLNELLVALASFDCRRAIALLCEAVAEYRQTPRHPRLRLGAEDLRYRPPDASRRWRKVADFAAKRRLFEGGKGPSERGT